MKPLRKTGQRLAAVTLAAALLVPASAFAEKRPAPGTERSRTAAQVIESILQKHEEKQKTKKKPAPAAKRGKGEKRTTGTVPRPAATRAATSAAAGPVSASVLVDEMNRHRAAAGLAPLRLNATLSAAAGDRARDMFEQRYFDHVAPDGTQPFVWASSRGYRYALIGENLATGQKSAREVVNQWMSSPGHRANILGSGFRDAGIAVAEGSPVGASRGLTFVAIYAAEAPRSTRA